MLSTQALNTLPFWKSAQISNMLTKLSYKCVGSTCTLWSTSLTVLSLGTCRGRRSVVATYQQSVRKTYIYLLQDYSYYLYILAFSFCNHEQRGSPIINLRRYIFRYARHFWKNRTWCVPRTILKSLITHIIIIVLYIIILLKFKRFLLSNCVSLVNSFMTSIGISGKASRNVFAMSFFDPRLDNPSVSVYASYWLTVESHFCLARLLIKPADASYMYVAGINISKCSQWKIALPDQNRGEKQAGAARQRN